MFPRVMNLLAAFMHSLVEMTADLCICEQHVVCARVSTYIAPRCAHAHRCRRHRARREWATFAGEVAARVVLDILGGHADGPENPNGNVVTCELDRASVAPQRVPSPMQDNNGLKLYA
jgi:hypothetical protein